MGLQSNFLIFILIIAILNRKFSSCWHYHSLLTMLGGVTPESWLLAKYDSFKLRRFPITSGIEPCIDQVIALWWWDGTCEIVLANRPAPWWDLSPMKSWNEKLIIDFKRFSLASQLDGNIAMKNAVSESYPAKKRWNFHFWRDGACTAHVSEIYGYDSIVAAATSYTSSVANKRTRAGPVGWLESQNNKN